jgi:hypothetical protein
MSCHVIPYLCLGPSCSHLLVIHTSLYAYISVIISCPFCTRRMSFFGCYRADHARNSCVGIAYDHHGGHKREINKNISNVTQSAMECHVPQSNSVRAISNTMRRRKYVMLLWVKLKGESMPRERASRNWHVKTPQSYPFSCCGVSRGQ